MYRINLKEAMELKKKKTIPKDQKVGKVLRYCSECNYPFAIINKEYGQVVCCPECGKPHRIKQVVKTMTVIEPVDVV